MWRFSLSLSHVVLRSLHGNDISELPDGIFNDAASLSHLWVNIQAYFTKHWQFYTHWTQTEQHSQSVTSALQFRHTSALCFPRVPAEAGQSVVRFIKHVHCYCGSSEWPRENECNPTCPSAHTLPVIQQLLHLIGWSWWKVVHTHTCDTHHMSTSLAIGDFWLLQSIVNGLVSLMCNELYYLAEIT